MLFNSFEFILIFFPVVLAFSIAVSAISKQLLINLLSATSIVFYAYGNFSDLPIFLISILVNYFCAQLILKHTGTKKTVAKKYFYFGVFFNISLLLGYKFASPLGQFISKFQEVGTIPPDIKVPLALSFITFQQIAFLYLVRDKNEVGMSFSRYLFFVSFFPQLIAGPIVTFQEMQPQYQRRRFLSFNRADVNIGLMLFAVGLFKKVVIADTIAATTGPYFHQMYAGQVLHSLDYILVSIAYTFQIYFDFSAYSDMAIGLARVFGLQLPANFLSPLKSASILTLWRNWHITLTRFVMTYVFVPTSRSTVSRTKRFIGSKTFGASLQQMPAIFLTFLIIGIWHGADLTFLVFGGLHACFASINYIWGQSDIRKLSIRICHPTFYKNFCIFLTFSAFTIGLIFFRAPSTLAAQNQIGGILNFNTSQPISFLTTMAWLDFAIMAMTPVIVFCSPNIYQILRRSRPILYSDELQKNYLEKFYVPSVAGAVTAAAFFLSVVFLTVGPKSFIYFQF